jgi:hypothetical protein
MARSRCGEELKIGRSDPTRRPNAHAAKRRKRGRCGQNVTQREISKYCQSYKPVVRWLLRPLDPDSAILLRVPATAVAELLQSPFTPITDGSGSFSFGDLAIAEQTGLRR